MPNGKHKVAQSKVFQLPISLEQLALAIEQLSDNELEELELAFDSELAGEIRRRQRSLPRLAKNGELLTLEDLKDE